VNTSRFSRPQDRSQVVGIFDPIEKHEKWLFTSDLRPIKNLLCGVIGFRGDECDHALVVSAWHQSIEGRRRFDVNRNSLRLRELDKVVELPVGAEDKKPLQGPRAGL
jgi:hypothetical protein